MAEPLAGIRVLDLSRLLPAPFATMILADLGADVIRVESPMGGDRLRLMPPYVKEMSAYFITINRNKRSVAIDMKSQTGRDVFFELVKTADVVVEGFKPGTVDRLGVGYEHVRAVKPDIIYCSLSGYGQTGPFRDRAGHDINFMGIGAALDLMTDPDVKPRIPGLFLGDLSGAYYATIGIISAIVQRQQSGVGAYVDACMLDGLMGLHTFLSARHLAAGLPAEHGTTQMTDAGPCYQVYETKDGRYVTFAPLEDRFWTTFCKLVDHQDWIPRQWDQSLVSELQQLFKQRTRDEWVSLSAEHDFCCEPVLTLNGALHHEQVVAREIVVEAEDPVAGTIRHVGPAIRFGDGRGKVRIPAPHVGEHTRDILSEAGLSADRIEALFNEGVIAENHPKTD